jgi:hypothetical protein
MFHVYTCMCSVVYCIEETVCVHYFCMLFVEDGVKRPVYHSVTCRTGDQQGTKQRRLIYEILCNKYYETSR